MPEGVTARVVKNTLMRRAAADSPFSVLSEITTGENFWVFVEGDDNLAEPIKYIGTFAKTMDKENVSVCAGFVWCITYGVFVYMTATKK